MVRYKIRYGWLAAMVADFGLVEQYRKIQKSMDPRTYSKVLSFQMRRAKSYSIVDHQLLHQRIFHRLSHEALALYLFLVVVGDRNGKSYYAERTIMDILRFNGHGFINARDELIGAELIRFSHPYFLVRNLECSHEIDKNQDNNTSPRHSKSYISANTERNDEFYQARLQILRRQLEAQSS